MKIRKAVPEDAVLIRHIVEQSIWGSYPDCYCPEAIEMFLEHHSMENIQKELKEHTLFLLLDGETAVGTGCLKGEEIKLLYFLPEAQGKGYGSFLLKALEEEAIRQGKTQVVLEASIPGRPLYLRRGYEELSHEQAIGPGGGVLDYWRMRKKLNHQTTKD